MSMKPNYFKIGLFVIMALCLLVAAIVFFGSGMFIKEKTYFETYFNGSVSGLSIGAPVEVRGVRMGQVEKILFTGDYYNIPRDSNEYFTSGSMVLVIASFDSGFCPANMSAEEMNNNVETLTSLGFRLRLASNILTGQAFLQGEYLDPDLFPVIDVPWEPQHCYISSAPSELTTMKQYVDNILRQLEQINTKRIGDLIDQLLVSVKDAIEDANVPGISLKLQSLVANTDTFVTNTDQTVTGMNIPAVMNNVQELLFEVRQTNQHIQELIKKPEDIDSQMANLAVMLNNLNMTISHIDKLVVSQSPKVEQTLSDLRDVSSDIKEIIGDLKKDPSQLIFSPSPPKSEVVK
ncbi:MAG: MCE family protein [Sedimentisphaerales bacterium]|nr:MCE family protein [Sedimentisphaerales bacterium]